MKGFKDIPECNKLFDQMFKEWEEIPKTRGNVGFDLYRRERKEIEARYLPKLQEAYEKYKQEHPEEFKGE